MKIMKKIVCKIVAVAILTASVAPDLTGVQAATKLKVSTSKIILAVGKSKIVSANKKVMWNSTNKKVAKVKKVNGKKAKIIAVKSGTCKIVAQYKKQKKIIKVTVKRNSLQQETVSPTPVVTATPNSTAVPEVTSTPVVSATPMPEIYTETAAQVTVKTISGTATGARLEITNGTNSMVIFGKQYEIQKLENGNWVKVQPINENVVFPAVGIGIAANGTGTVDVNWTDYYGTLETGEYRIVKEYMVDGVSYNIASIVSVPDFQIPIDKIYTETQAHITVKTVSSSATSARLEIRNDNNAEVIYGKAYEIQKLVNGSWENMKPLAENMVFPLVGQMIEHNTTGYIDVDWNDYYGKLESGQYRIVKEYSVGGVIYKIASGFSIS